MKAYFKQLFDTIQIELQVIDLEGCDISLDEAGAMIEFFKKCLLDLRNFLLAKEAMTVEEEITFFKEMKPEVLGRLLYFHKIHNIELNRPTGSNDTLKEYYNAIAVSGGENGCVPFIEFILGVIDETLALEHSSPRPIRDRIAEQMRANPKITRNELAGILGLTPDGVKYHLQKMTAEGVIIHHGSARNGNSLHYKRLKRLIGFS